MIIEKLRICLICRQWFQSASPANRVCKRCKKSRKNLKGGVECVPISSLACANPYKFMTNFEASVLVARAEPRTRPDKPPPKPMAADLLGLDLVLPPPPETRDAAAMLGLELALPI